MPSKTSASAHLVLCLLCLSVKHTAQASLQGQSLVV